MRLLLTWCLMATCTSLSAQQWDSTHTAVPVHAIKFSPFHLLNFYPTIEFSYEQKIFPRVTLQAEGGYVLDYPDSEGELYQNKRGVKLKLEGRYYPGSVRRDKISYLAIEPYVNAVDFDRYGAVEECFDADCRRPYTRQIVFTMKYREKGATLKVGMLWYVASDFFLDVSIGGTLRDVVYEEPSLPNEVGYNREAQFFQIPDEDDRVVGSPYMGLRFGYRFR